MLFPCVRTRRWWPLGLLLSIGVSGVATAGDWSRFRGPNGDGAATEEVSLPTTFSETENLQWKMKLPGPGLSSPIVVGDRVYVTCWSGYGVDRNDLGDQQNLKRHLVCLDKSNGTVIWDKSVAAVLPEEEFRGMFAENGYASHTPVSDGERVYAFYGKSGVYAYDLEGNELWHKDVGNGDDRRGWGTASSPLIHENLLIVPAFIESSAIYGFDKVTGEEVWKQQADGFGSTWGTPVLVKVDDTRTDLVVGVPYEIWGLNPTNGKLKWYCESVESDSICSSLLAHDGIVYCIEGRNGGAIAVKVGGEGDVSSTNVVWSNRERGRIATPVFHDGRVYWVNGGTLRSVVAQTGDGLVQSRMKGEEEIASPGGGQNGPPPGAGGQGGGRFGGGRGGGQDYSSPVIGDGKLYYVTRGGEISVIQLGEEPKLIATNNFESDTTDFSATPAISDGRLYIRSNSYLYCVGLN
jgi:outer membrane protein assembly factor BamB